MIRIAVLATLEGPYQVLGADAMRGVTLALDEIDGQIAGQAVEVTVESTNAMSASATQACERLVDVQGVDVVLGPLSGDEGDAVRDFARAHPDHTFINGVAGSQQIYNPAANFYSFSPNGVQYIAGLGTYCYERGFRRVVTLSEAYSYTFAQVGGFALEFCKAGGEIVEMLWCELGTSDFAPYIGKFPRGIDAVCSLLGGSDSVRFLQQYRELEGKVPIIGGTLQGDPTTLHFVSEYADLLDGVLTASPICDDGPDENWRRFVQNYRRAYADEGYYSPSLIAFGYYSNMKALLLALAEVEGDLSDGQAKLQAALTSLEFVGLTGPLKLDRHRFPIIDNFVNEIAVKPDGSLYTKMVKRIEAVDSTLGYSDEDWLALGEFDQHNMPCGADQDQSFEAILRRARERKG
jgi:branched-chain amino acid transport system substrate-binding protein